MAKLSSGQDLSREVEAFVSGASVQTAPKLDTPPRPKREAPANKKVEKPSYPWEDPGLRKDVIKHFNLRLNEITWTKLLFIFEHSKGSRHSVILDMLETEMERRIEKIKEEGTV